MTTMDIGDFVVDGHKIHLSADQTEIWAELNNPALFDVDQAELDKYVLDCGVENQVLLVTEDGRYVSLDQLASERQEAIYEHDHIEAERWQIRNNWR